MKTCQKYSISDICKIITPIAEEFGVRKMSVFGSYARGEASENSDIDFHIIDRGTLRGLIRLASFELALEESLNIPVDVVTTDSLFEDIRKHIEQEELVVYDAS